MKPDPVKPKILIVDDTPVNIKLLGEMLRSDYETFFATNGEKALKVAQEQSPDLILLDIMMPGMDGYTVCKKLKVDSRTKNIPVIFITAKTQMDDEVMGLQVGAVDYITKPFRIPIVKARIRTHLDLKRKYDLLESLALVDGLTELPNRRRLDEALDQEWRRNMRRASPLSMIMMDIDFFKQYNDTYGHTAGDKCLKLIAQSLSDSVKRGGDLVARYGGEEFAALLPETEKETAIIVAERIKADVEALKIPHATSSIADHVTLSLGVATQIPSMDSSPEALVQAADAMLYKAKQEGRNRVVSSKE